MSHDQAKLQDMPLGVVFFSLGGLWYGANLRVIQGLIT